MRDVSYALRLLVRSPMLTVTAVVSVAVGIAGATAVFAAADALLLRPIAGVSEAAHVVEIARTTNGSGWGPTSPMVVDRLGRDTRQLTGIAAQADASPFSFADGGRTERVFGWMVSANFFRVVGTLPSTGRLFRDEDGLPGAQPVVVLTHRFWRLRLGSDPTAVGRAVRLNGVPAVVIGVAASDFDGLSFVGGDLWVPTSAAPALRGGEDSITDPASFWLRAVGRLAPGGTIASARAELNTLMSAIKKDAPTIPASHGVAVESLGRTPVPVRPAFAAFVALLFGLTVGLLAIVCSNVAGMFLARAAARRREMATRLALGASRRRLIGQMLVETLVLFSIAAVAAIPMTMLSLNALTRVLPAMPVPIVLDLAVSARAMAVAAGLSLATGFIFGLVPARTALRLDLAGMLHGQAATANRDRLRMRRLLVATQVAVSLTLAITAGVFVRSLDAAARVDLGFQTANVDVVTLETTLAGSRGNDPQPIVDRILERVAAIESVEAVGHGFRLPLVAGTFAVSPIARVDGQTGDDTPVRNANWDIVSPGYFRTLRLPIERGRAFSETDRAGAPLVAIVNQTFARQAWPDGDVVGRRFVQSRASGGERSLEVVGVVGDSVYRSIGEPARAVVYVPFAQEPRTHVELFVRHAPGRSPAADVRRVISESTGLPVVAMQTFDDATGWALLPQRTAAALAAGGGVVGLVLSALGLYGLVAFITTQRSREFAVRMALGATPAQVTTLVLQQTVWLGITGVLAGTGMAAALGQLIRSQGWFVTMSPLDPVAFGIATLLMTGVLVGGSLIPARRAASANPLRSLRAE